MKKIANGGSLPYIRLMKTVFYPDLIRQKKNAGMQC